MTKFPYGDKFPQPLGREFASDLCECVSREDEVYQAHHSHLIDLPSQPLLTFPTTLKGEIASMNSTIQRRMGDVTLPGCGNLIFD